jgi:hypothetical protein
MLATESGDEDTENEKHFIHSVRVCEGNITLVFVDFFSPLRQISE